MGTVKDNKGSLVKLNSTSSVSPIRDDQKREICASVLCLTVVTIACCFRLHDWPISDQSTWRTSDARNWFVLVRVSRRGDKSFLRLYSRNHTAASRDRFLKASLLFYAALVGAGFLAYCTWSGTLQKSRAVGPFEDGPPIAAGYAFNI
jgi:hypothetical protein